MVRENIRFQEGNFTSDGVYFYSMLDGSQVLQQKVDDGSIAFTYPLDTAVGGNIEELQWDGVNFWSIEDSGTGFSVRKWGIQAFVCKQQQKIDFNNDATHTYDSDAFALEHYRLTVGINDNGGGGYTTGLTDINISDNSMIEPGDVLTFVRTDTSAAQRVGTSFVEQGTVQTTISGSTTQVRLTAAMSGDPHGDGKGFRGPDVTPSSSEPPTPDKVYLTKYIWVANANAPSNPGTPAIYKARASNGSNIIQFSGTQYDSVQALAFYTKYTQGTFDPGGSREEKYNDEVTVDGDEGGRQTYLLVARGSSLLFFNTDTNIIDRSMVMNNIKVDTINIWDVFDMEVLGVEPNIVLFRLQLGTTYKNPSLVLTDTAWSEYNYEKQLLRRVVNSISVGANPSIIPADGNSTSAITAVLRDQYNDLAPSGKTVNWSDDSGGPGGGAGQGLFNSTSATDAFGEAENTYKAGTTEQDVKITAAVTNGLID